MKALALLIRKDIDDFPVLMDLLHPPPKFNPE
jgi:hypothetical protein